MHFVGGSTIDYVFSLVDLDWYFYAISVGLIIFIGLVWGKWRIGALIAYGFFIFAVTLFSRKPVKGPHFEPRLFWSWNVPRWRLQNIMNIVAFIPIGLLGGKWGWKVILFALVISSFIELTQLITKTGLFEFDDIIHNTLGAVIGLEIFLVVKKCIYKTKGRRKTS